MYVPGTRDGCAPRRRARVLLELPEHEARARERGHDLAEPPEALDLVLRRGRACELEGRPAAIDLQRVVEVVLAPAQRRIDALGHGMLLVQQEVAAAPERSDD